MKADFYVVIMGRYLFWIWLGLVDIALFLQSWETGKTEKKERLYDLTSGDFRWNGGIC